ncbi:hypothetical protein B0H13DRAFT_1859523 [Mycena leptocephala]|nr:hypothetical protein B0H13DRAFT_1859523 [Mycena leptocephala]
MPKLTPDSPVYGTVVLLVRSIPLDPPWLSLTYSVPGGCLDFVLQGIIFCQVLSTLFVWFQNILFFTDVEGALNLNYAWWQYGNLPMLATVGLYVQAYYVYWRYVLSAAKIYVMVPICALLLAAYVCAM